MLVRRTRNMLMAGIVVAVARAVRASSRRKHARLRTAPRSVAGSTILVGINQIGRSGHLAARQYEQPMKAPGASPRFRNRPESGEVSFCTNPWPLPEVPRPAGAAWASCTHST